MSPEEAGELVLRGAQWAGCTYCHGQGRIQLEQSTHEETIGAPLQYTICTVCLGSPYCLPPEFVEACAMVGATLPALHASWVIPGRGETKSRIVNLTINLIADPGSRLLVDINEKGEVRLTHLLVDPQVQVNIQHAVAPGTVTMVWAE